MSDPKEAAQRSAATAKKKLTLKQMTPFFAEKKNVACPCLGVTSRPRP